LPPKTGDKISTVKYDPVDKAGAVAGGKFSTGKLYKIPNIVLTFAKIYYIMLDKKRILGWR